MVHLGLGFPLGGKPRNFMTRDSRFEVRASEPFGHQLRMSPSAPGQRIQELLSEMDAVLDQLRQAQDPPRGHSYAVVPKWVHFMYSLGHSLNTSKQYY